MNMVVCWIKNLSCYAAQGGSVDCLKYTREQGCEWDYRVCEWAAYYGQLACRKYAHENGCSLTERVVWYSVKCKYLH